MVNGIFVALALDSFGGLSTDMAYHKGLRYNDTLAAVEAHDEPVHRLERRLWLK